MILGIQPTECSCRVISIIFKAQHVRHATVFQWQSSNFMTQDLGSLLLLTFLLVFYLLILLIQRSQVLKWMYFFFDLFIVKYLEHNLICNYYLGLFALFQLFHLIGELIFTSWRKLCNEQKHTSLLKRLLTVFQDKRRNWWKEIKSESWAFLRWHNLLVYHSPLKTYLDPSLA